MVPADPRRGQVPEPGRREHPPARGHRGDPRADPGRHGPPAGDQPHHAGRHGRPVRPADDDRRERTALFTRLAPMLKTTVGDLVDVTTACGTPGAEGDVCWNGSQFQPIPVAKDVSEQLALSILERAEDYPGVTAELETEREYPAPYGANAAHELGYIGPVTQNELDASKATRTRCSPATWSAGPGWRRSTTRCLRGVDGIKQLSVDRAGNVTGIVSETPPQAGDNLVTNIDARVQAVLEQQLAAAVQRARAQTDPSRQALQGRLRRRRGHGRHATVTSSRWRACRRTTRPSGSAASPPRSSTSLTAKSVRAAAGVARLPGRVRPGSTFKVVSLDRDAAADGYTTARAVPVPVVADGRRPQVHQLREQELRRHQPRAGHRGVLRHGVLRRGLRTVASDGGAHPVAPQGHLHQRGAAPGGSARRPASTCPGRRRATSPPGRPGSTAGRRTGPSTAHGPRPATRRSPRPTRRTRRT